MTDARMDDWVAALATFPAWAISRAVADYLRTETRRPVPAAIVQRCVAEMRPVRAALSDAEAAVQARLAPPRRAPTPEERARVAALVASVAQARR